MPFRILSDTIENTLRNTGSVTIHSDITSAGSGDIITAAERTQRVIQAL